MAKVHPLTHGFSGVVSADNKESLLSVPIQVRAVGYPLAFRPRQSPALPCPEALTSPNTCPLQCAGKGRFTQHSSSSQQASQDLDPCSLQTYRDRSGSLPCSVGPAGLDVEQSKKTLFSVSSAFSCPGELEEGPFLSPLYSLCSWSLACAALNFSNQYSFQAAFVEMKQVREAVFIPSHVVKGSNVFPSALYCIFGSLSNRLTRISLLSRMETLRLTLACILHGL